MTPERTTELLDLLEALCEDRMTDAQQARLQQLVLADRECLRTYLDYIDLHGTLHWDAAAAAADPQLAEQTLAASLTTWEDADERVAVHAQPQASASSVAATNPEATPSSRWSRRVMMGLVASAACLSLVVWLSRGGNVPDLTPDDSPPLTADTPGVTAPSTDPLPGPPRIRLDQPTAVAGTPAPVPAIPSDSPGSPDAALVAAPSSSDSGAPIIAAINADLRQHWTEAEVEPSPPADDAEWLRRISLDLLGHIPEVDDVERFLADRRPDKRSRLVENLLDHPDYVRHQATVWANLLIGRNPPGEVDREGLARYLRDQFRQNRPWSETAGELIAAEGTQEQNGATNFLLAHLNNEAVPATAVTARVFLCQQIQCTQCHAHPFSAQDQSTFWEFNGFFQQTAVVRRETPADDGTMQATLELVSRQVGGATHFEDRAGVMRTAFPQYDGREIDPAPETNRRRELARLLTAGDAPQLAASMVNRTWAQFFGYGFTVPVEDMGPHNPASHPELLERLTREFVRSGYDVRQLTRWIVGSDAYQLSSRFNPTNADDDPEQGERPLFSRMYLRSLTPEQVFDSLLVATRADRAGVSSWEEVERRRTEWLSQFFTPLDNEENCEATTFDGSMPQALMMMNGDLVRHATEGATGTYLGELIGETATESAKIRRLCLAALSREPTPQELKQVRALLRQYTIARDVPPQVAMDEGLKDVFWAYLNSNEFVLNH